MNIRETLPSMQQIFIKQNSESGITVKNISSVHLNFANFLRRKITAFQFGIFSGIDILRR